MIKVAVPKLPVTVTNIPFKASTKQEKVNEIQRMLLADLSDDDEEELTDKSKDYEKLLLEDVEVSQIRDLNIARIAKRCPKNISSVVNVSSCFYLIMSLLLLSLLS